jgi:hypothetical protein
VHHREELMKSLADLMAAAPPESLIVVESDERFSPTDLPDPEAWRIRHYSPATLFVWRSSEREELVEE